jgi:hypothetical protein
VPLSYFGAWTAEWAFTVALGIVAYRDGGATTGVLVGLARMLPAAVKVLASDHFLPVVIGFTPSAREAGTAVDTLLDRFRP